MTSPATKPLSRRAVAQGVGGLSSVSSAAGCCRRSRAPRRLSRRRRGAPLRTQRVRADRHRQHRHRPHQAHRVRPGPVHRPRHAGRRGARRRLVADARRACAVPTPSSTRTSRSACRAPAARPRSPTPTSRCARPARPRAPCWSRPRPQTWSVPAGEITVERGVLTPRVGPTQGQLRRVRGRGGQAAGAEMRRSRIASAVPPDRPRRCRQALDSRAKSNGTAQFTIDVREPEHADRAGRAPAALRRQGASRSTTTAARRCPAWSTSKPIPQGVAVYAERHCGRRCKGRAALKVTWDDSERRDSAAPRS